MILVHTPNVCAGETCAIHNPSHHMADLPFSIRVDRGFLVERHCEHGVGHPDPNSVRWLELHGEDIRGGIHGCCHEQCCLPPLEHGERNDPSGRT